MPVSSYQLPVTRKEKLCWELLPVYSGQSKRLMVNLTALGLLTGHWVLLTVPLLLTGHWVLLTVPLAIGELYIFIASCAPMIRLIACRNCSAVQCVISDIVGSGDTSEIGGYGNVIFCLSEKISLWVLLSSRNAQ